MLTNPIHPCICIEISLSARLWTSGYDMFSPTVDVINHYYVRRHMPKFWETVNRVFKSPGAHNDVTSLVIHRVKNMLGYSESASENVYPKSVLYRLEDWGIGKKRSLQTYLKMVGLNMKSKQTTSNTWCFDNQWPEVAEKFILP